MAISIARRKKAAASTQGSAVPQLLRSSLTILKPGSSTTKYPRRRNSTSKEDLPPPEQPEITTNRSIYERLSAYGPAPVTIGRHLALSSDIRKTNYLSMSRCTRRVE